MRKNLCNGHFSPGLCLDLRAPQVESYHSGFCDTASGRVQNIRFRASTANKASDTSYKQGISLILPPKAHERRPNLVFYRYELNKKRSIYLFTERRLYSTNFTPQRDQSTIESIKRFQYLTKSPGGVSLHLYWVHMVLLYYVFDTRNVHIVPCSERLFPIVTQQLPFNCLPASLL